MPYENITSQPSFMSCPQCGSVLPTPEELRCHYCSFGGPTEPDEDAIAKQSLPQWDEPSWHFLGCCLGLLALTAVWPLIPLVLLTLLRHWIVISRTKMQSTFGSFMASMGVVGGIFIVAFCGGFLTAGIVCATIEYSDWMNFMWLAPAIALLVAILLFVKSLPSKDFAHNNAAGDSPIRRDAHCDD
jgi:hypothetical protein